MDNQIIFYDTDTTNTDFSIKRFYELDEKCYFDSDPIKTKDDEVGKHT